MHDYQGIQKLANTYQMSHIISARDLGDFEGYHAKQMFRLILHG